LFSEETVLLDRSCDADAVETVVIVVRCGPMDASGRTVNCVYEFARRGRNEFDGVERARGEHADLVVKDREAHIQD
jgi:hypothetical protein